MCLHQLIGTTYSGNVFYTKKYILNKELCLYIERHSLDKIMTFVVGMAIGQIGLGWVFEDLDPPYPLERVASRAPLWVIGRPVLNRIKIKNSKNII